MALTVPVTSKFNSSARITAVFSGNNLSYGQEDGLLTIGDAEFKYDTVNSLFEFSFGDVLVGTGESLVTIRDGEEIRSKNFEVGIDSIHGKDDHAIVIDGLGKAHLVKPTGETIVLDAQSVLFAKISSKIAIATESGSVMTFDFSGKKEWERPKRGEVGERITAIGWDNDCLVVAREGHGLVPGDEEALEVEYWISGTLKNRIDVKNRIVAIDGPWMGLDMGGVMFGENIVFEIQHPVRTIINKGDYCLIGCWFHLHKVTEDGNVWSVETKGMVEHVSSNKDGSRVLICGSDQNDYTESEPVVLIDSLAEPIPLIEEESAIDDWGEAPALDIDPDELYGTELSIEEIAGISNEVKTEFTGLLDALNDEIINEPSIEIEDDLMLALSLDAEEIIAPVPDAGGDQSVKASDDGTAIIVLDATGTTDPQERITSWSWVDSNGKEIANSPQVKVKLNKGNHRIELRIKDRDDRWASDSIDIRVG